MLTALKKSIQTFLDADGLTLAAAIAYYTTLSASPILVLLLWMSGQLGYSDSEAILKQLGDYAGSQTEDFAHTLLLQIKSKPQLGNVAGTIGFAVLLASAGGVFGQLQASLDKIWKQKNTVAFSIWHWLSRRIVSILMIFALGFITLGSLVGTSVLTFVASYFSQYSWMSYLFEGANFVLSFALFSLFFSALFKFLPDRRLSWSQVWKGGAITALLFGIGKQMIGLYLGYSGVGSAFGAAGSFAVFLLWVYYSAAIFLFGASITQQLADNPGEAPDNSEKAAYA